MVSKRIQLNVIDDTTKVEPKPDFSDRSFVLFCFAKTHFILGEAQGLRGRENKLKSSLNFFRVSNGKKYLFLFLSVCLCLCYGSVCVWCVCVYREISGKKE